MKLYVVYDRLAEQCGPVYEAINDAVATRAYKQMMQNAHAGSVDEFILYCVGEIDQVSMEIVTGSRRVELAWSKEEVTDAR